MVSWRALAAGVGSVPLSFAWLFLAHPVVVVLAGFVSGGLVGAVAPLGLSSGAVHGFLTRGAVVAGVVASLYA